MTSTNLYQGYDQGRPTSKVMAPPGGASSNIFGVEPYVPTENEQRKPQQHQQHSSDSSRLFGGDAPEPSYQKQAPTSEVKIASAPAGVNTHAGNSRNHASFKEEEDESPVVTQCRKRFFRDEGRGAYNPITGEDYPDKVSQAPAQRTRQPPGGKSSGPLW